MKKIIRGKGIRNKISKKKIKKREKCRKSKKKKRVKMWKKKKFFLEVFYEIITMSSIVKVELMIFGQIKINATNIS